MRALFWGPCLGAALGFSLSADAQPVLTVTTDTEELGTIPMPEGQDICLRWRHSVTGGKVADCFANRAGQLMLTRSYLHDFAAGLGEVEGRGTLTPAPGGGYWITDMDEPLSENSLTLRIGSERVGHILYAGDTVLPLSTLAPGARASLTLRAD